VYFVRSTNVGAAWSAPQQLSAAGENFVWPSHVAVAPNGDVYASYHADTCGAATASIFVIRDSTGGANLAANPPVIGPKSSFQAAVTCNRQDQMGTVPQTDFWMQGAVAPYVLPDPVRPGTLYVVANDDPNNSFGNGDDGDVVLARSTDYGNTWTLSTVSHAPAGTLQAFPTGAIDQNGRLAVHWYDTRRGLTNAGGNFLLDLYATVSVDGGLTFTNDFRVNDAAFDPDVGAPCRFGPAPNCGTVLPAGSPTTVRIGEYNGVAATDGLAYAVWTGNTVGGNPPAPTGQQIVLDPFSILGAIADRFEPNDSLQPGVATDLGAHASYNQPGLTIHTDTDEDFFKVTALTTGKLDVQIAMTGRIADLDVQIRDAFNNAIATSTLGADTSNTEQLTIPVVAGQAYFVRVLAEPGQIPPFNVYNLNMTNTPAPVPFQLALAPGSDTGQDEHDNVTNDNTPTVRLQVDLAALSGLSLSPQNVTPQLTDDSPGYKVGVYVDGALAGFATPTGGGVFEFTFPSALADGLRSITAKVTIVDGTLPNHAVGQGGESSALLITIDTAPPASPAAPDLLASSDTGGVDDDNVTTVQTPQFSCAGENNALVRLYAGAAQVGSSLMTSGGTCIIASSPLADGVYVMTLRLEDRAGNVSAASQGLLVTIAHNSLTLPGGTTTPAAGAVTVDLAAGTVAGFVSPSASGKFGVVGIPVVNLNANGNALTILGTAGDDALTYTPTGANAGNVVVGATGQLFSLANVSGTLFTIDPLTGNNDVVTVMGGAGADAVTVNVDTTNTAQVGSLLKVSVPNADVDRLAVVTLDGQDTITVNVKDTVNAKLSVDAGNPAPAPNKAGDTLQVNAVSPKGFVQNKPGGPTQGSGVVVVTYPKTTNTTVTIEYTAVEKFSK
jgi:hypothetical protein